MSEGKEMAKSNGDDLRGVGAEEGPRRGNSGLN